MIGYLKANWVGLLFAAALCLGVVHPDPVSVPVLFAMATLQLGAVTRNAMLDAIETAIGTAPMMELRSGALEANCAAASTGSILSRDALPSDWLGAAAAGVKSKAGTWTLTGLAGIATSNIGHFRIFLAGSPDQCEIQGDVTVTGGGGAMTVDNVSLAAGQVATVNTFALTAGNA